MGGSHKPIISAIEEVEAEFVVFVCSMDDEVSGFRGSYSQIEDEGKIIKSDRADAKPTLKNIPTQAGLKENEFSVLLINADEIEQSYSAISNLLETLASEYRKVVCDYTGGTKTMSASLVMAAVDNHKVQLQFVAGPRTNLEKIKTGHHFVQTAKVGRPRFQNELRVALEFWISYNYASSLSRLQKLKPLDTKDRITHQKVLAACNAFVAWDVFDHVKALNQFELIENTIDERYSVHVTQVKKICKGSVISDPLKILDLWLNALRCAERHRFEDATARA